MQDRTHPELKNKQRRNVLKECIADRKLYVINGLWSLALACIICLSMPKQYAAQMEITDEHKISMELSVGLNPLETMVKRVQQIEEGMRNPETYIKIFESESFINQLLRINVDKYNMTYGEYLKTMNKEPWWAEPFITRDSIYSRNLLNNKIRYKLSSKYYTIKLQIIDNDPDVSAVMTDSLCVLLSKFLEYHRKTINDAKMYDALIRYKEAENNYHSAQNKYIAYTESHMESELIAENAIIEGLISERDNAFKIYNEACMKYEHYKLAVNRNLPYFSILYYPTVPNKPCSPSWFGYIMVFLCITWTSTTWWILYKNSKPINREE